jgi:hypothetical protein
VVNFRALSNYRHAALAGWNMKSTSGLNRALAASEMAMETKFEHAIYASINMRLIAALPSHDGVSNA